MGTFAKARRKSARADAAGRTDGLHYLSFGVANDAFATPISSIREIVPYRDPAGVPAASPHIRGVIDLDGQVVPVIDLSARTSRSATGVAPGACILILEVRHLAAAQTIGIIADAVNAVLYIPDSAIACPPGPRCPERAWDMARVGEVFILDIERVLSAQPLPTRAGTDGSGHAALAGMTPDQVATHAGAAR